MNTPGDEPEVDDIDEEEMQDYDQVDSRKKVHRLVYRRGPEPYNAVCGRILTDNLRYTSYDETVTCKRCLEIMANADDKADAESMATELAYVEQKEQQIREAGPDLLHAAKVALYLLLNDRVYVHLGAGDAEVIDALQKAIDKAEA